MQDDHRRALACARHFRKLGLCPLPSRMDRKGPALASFAEHWESPVPESVYTESAWRTSNIQLMTGTQTPGPTKILVVDCDGDEAWDTWVRICAREGLSVRSAWVAVTGSGGRHTYFRIPDGMRLCPSGPIWGLWDTYGSDGKGCWTKHKEVRILADRALAIAPPSIHVDTGRRYEFIPDLGPKRHRLPDVAPAWLLDMPRLVAPRCVEPKDVPPPRIAYMAPGGPVAGRYQWREVLDAIHDKAALAAYWGLRLATGRANAAGRVACHALGREDRTPSASINAMTGIYRDHKTQEWMTLFNLGAALQPGAFANWMDCRDWCGERFVGRRPSRAHAGA